MRRKQQLPKQKKKRLDQIENKADGKKMTTRPQSGPRQSQWNAPLACKRKTMNEWGENPTDEA